jgi:drug/metabolite transporter (DMT)-like permease
MNGYVLLVLSQIMLGSVAVFARWASLPAEVIVLFRCLVAALAIGVVVSMRHTLMPYLKRKRTLGLLMLTGFFMATNWYFFFKAVLTTTITNSILLYNMAPIFVILSAVFFLRESPTLRQIGCVGLSFLGVVFIVASNGNGLSLDPGCVYAIIAAALYSQVTIIGRYLRDLPAPVITLFQTGVGVLMFLPLSWGSFSPAALTSTQWGILIIMGLFHTAVPYLMYFKALQTVKAAIAGILQYVYTLSTIVFGALFFSEPVTLFTILGGSLIVVSSYVALKKPGVLTLADLADRRAKAVAQ